MARDTCFPPLTASHTRVLLLGSLPGQASLAANRYYAHPRNQFWRLLGDVLNIPLTTMTYDERVEHLLAAGVGLWDVVGEAERKGSLDADLRRVRYNDLHQLVADLPHLRAVGFNGQTAARAGAVLAEQTVALLSLPSSSPAYTLPYDNKLAQWREIARYL
ncbi:MAG: DNA-deoxyinosine glycosylase [Paludibacterium sp.]|uniref:DNA-deoxyinosine glycosylase n=1 Tax=Paludibacterium sp. TaxID=1917523 RepID=UPI0025F25B07|nr:DNA-deoxyinosine glycosylase [Paludibacterium sp.]MBV8048943.1 DNA-deoxyinosine glycosylase [Paludibacterium sp.]MBV8646760.1 DNA-deoxyinosine glycosylase [Paludibacterium sp.]